jgi:RNA polymerase sigma factor for flagellar operon FliA
MRVSRRIYAKAAAAAREANIRSLSGGRRSDDEPAGCFSADTLADTRPTDPARSLAGKQLRDEIVTGLSRSERLITILYYYEELTMKEIGKTLDLSESRVSQMHTSIVKRLRARLNPRLLAS